MLIIWFVNLVRELKESFSDLKIRCIILCMLMFKTHKRFIVYINIKKDTAQRWSEVSSRGQNHCVRNITLSGVRLMESSPSRVKLLPHIKL